MTAQSIRGTWLGIHLRTGEHVLAVHICEVVRLRIIHRLPAEKQWNPEAVLTIRAMPRSPSPREDPELRLVGEREEKPEVVPIARPGHQVAHGAPRELRIDA